MGNAQGIRAGRAFVELFADSTALVRGLKAARASVQSWGDSLQGLGTRFMAAAGVMALPFVAGGKAFADFESQMANVSTMLDEPAKYMGTFTTSVRSMAVEFGESTETISKGLYDILSASIDPAAALDVLRVSLKSAKGGFSDTATATAAMINVLNAFHVPASEAANVADMMFQTVKRGVTTFPELAQYLGSVTATAYAAGVSMEEMGAALSTMTRSGLKTDLAVTALQNILKEFLKPTAEGAEAAKALGIELNTATLRSKGLLGVMQQLAQASPEEVATIFPDVRGLRGILSLKGDLAGFVKDMDLMAGKAGAADAAYQKVAGTLKGAFNKALQAVVQTASVIGEAIAGPLKLVGKAIVLAYKAFIPFLQSHQQVVRIVALVAIGVGAAGAALFAFGLSLKAAGIALGGLASLAGLAQAMLAPLAAILAGLLSPLGAVAIAVIGLGGYLVYATGIGGKALGWLGQRFATLKDDALGAYQGIADALAAGDISLAARVLWLTLKMEWTRGVNFLEKLWLGFRNTFIRIGYDAWYGLLSLVEIVWHALEVGWIETVAVLGNVWTGFASFFARTWENMKAWAAKAWTWIKGLFDDSTAESRSAAYAEIDRGRQVAISQINDDAQRDRAQREADRQRKREESSRTHEATLAELGKQDLGSNQALDAEYAQRMGRNEADLAEARDAWRSAIEAARKKAAPAGKKLEAPDKITKRASDALAGSGDALSQSAKSIGVKGTFNSAALRGLEAGDASSRIAKATEDTARQTKALVDMARRGDGLTFTD